MRAEVVKASSWRTTGRLALAAFTAGAAGLASAQSSIGLFGTLDVNARWVKNDGSPRRYSLSQDGLNPSQLGVRGIEDLGDGLKAGFTLVSTVFPDTGTASGKFWNRRSTVSLFGKGGELRLGRDYVPTFLNRTTFDALGAIGIGNSFNVWQLQATYPVSPSFGNFARADNAIGYFLPPGLGGLYGQAMVAASEGASNQGRVLGARLGWASGRLDVALAWVRQRFDLDSNPAVTGITAGSHQDTTSLGGSYEFGPVKVLGYLDHDEREALRETKGTLSALIRAGASELHLGYSRSRLTNRLATNANTVSQVAATAQYNLSRRTAVYATAARLSNGDHPLGNVTQSVAGWNATFAGSAQTAQPGAGGNSKGLELGIRHFF
ncbi:MAG: porin [Caldimonas sp.]